MENRIVGVSDYNFKLVIKMLNRLVKQSLHTAARQTRVLLPSSHLGTLLPHHFQMASLPSIVSPPAKFFATKEKRKPSDLGSTSDSKSSNNMRRQKSSQIDIIKASDFNPEEASMSQNYKRLVFDTLNSTQFLNSSLTLGQLEKVLEIFRETLFEKQRKNQATTRIAQFLKQSLEAEQESELVAKILEETYAGDLQNFSRDIFQASQIVLEFLDKG